MIFAESLAQEMNDFTGHHSQYYGWAELEPQAPVVAGSMGTFRLTYHVGRYGLDDGGTLKIAVRFVSDWGYPQCEDPAAPNFYTVSTSGAASIRHRFDPKGYVRPRQKCLVVDIEEWALSEGDSIVVVYGDRSHGSPGTAVQTFVETRFEFTVAIDPFGTGVFAELEEQPGFEIVPGPAAKLVVVAPTEVSVGEPFDAGVKLEDRWGNPAVAHEGPLRLEAPAEFECLPSSVDMTARDRGVRRLRGIVCRQPGLQRITASAADGALSAESNPIVSVASPRAWRPLWGDLHGQSEETVGTNSIEQYFEYARDVAMVDFVGHQGNDFQITPEFWERINRCAGEYDDPGAFATFPGYEWSATTPAGGDRNVYYLSEGEEIFRTSHWLVDASTGTGSDRYPVGDLFAELKSREAIVVPHIGGRPANLKFHCPELEPVIEIYSAWGQFEWLLREAIERGYKVGIVCGSDDHKGRPGASYPGSSSFGVYGGLTCVLASELTRASLFEALRARRCYGTTGSRIALDVRSGEHRMGEEFAVTAAPTISVVAHGTADIEEIAVMRGLECIHRVPEVMPRHETRVRIVWSGARIKGRDRLARWDGSLAVEGGIISDARGYAFDSAAEGITEQRASYIAWKSVTSGDEDGVILDLQADADATLSFHTDITRFSLPLRDLGASPYIVEAGGVDLRVVVERLPLGLRQRSSAFTHTDEAAPSGCHAYYVRLTQVDGARAWSSPFYIHVS